MKMTKKLCTLVCVLVMMVATLLPSNALAASKTYKGASSYSYTIKTGKKAATLTLKPSKGTRARKYVKRSNSRKTHIDKWKLYGQFTVTVNGKSYTVTNRNVKVTLPANGTYRVSVRCTGTQFHLEPAYNPFFYSPVGSEYWYKDPSIKLSVNNWAKIN